MNEAEFERIVEEGRALQQRFSQYKGLRAPFLEWPFVAAACQRWGRALVKRELTETLPEQVDEAFQKEDRS